MIEFVLRRFGLDTLWVAIAWWSGFPPKPYLVAYNIGQKRCFRFESAGSFLFFLTPEVLRVILTQLFDFDTTILILILASDSFQSGN